MHGCFPISFGGGARPDCPQKYTPMFSYTCLKGKNTRIEKATAVYIKRRSIIDSLIRYFVHSFIHSVVHHVTRSFVVLFIETFFLCIADIMSPHLEVPSAAAAAAADGDLDDGGDHSLIVSRGRDILIYQYTD